MPGMGELLIILVIVLLIFGAGKLPAIGDSLGRSIKNFRRAAGGNDEIEVSRKDRVEAKKADRQIEQARRAELQAADDDIADADVLADRKQVAKEEV